MSLKKTHLFIILNNSNLSFLNNSLKKDTQILSILSLILAYTD